MQIASTIAAGLTLAGSLISVSCGVRSRRKLLACTQIALVFAATSCLPDAQAAVVGRSHRDTLPPISFDQNPYSYAYGSVAKSDFIQDVKGQSATNITFQPRYASEAFTESLLFCGDRADAFVGVNGPVVVTYKRVSHQTVKGVPCFDLVSVDRIESVETVRK